ncbi:hypothetical protein NDI56_10175 [Haloarcula sp. S1CR25-12]|uniref:DUF4129 domain-containing protein n=1 Tax=Haloarcula saliterrae TaxID=2950534 RepID=A0ABU2FD64_9EURY|nr:hypothetical protein [Haloarcula sp. S1CR25-12]MDS0259756.1 hypothetical protein [Haloarcula sp. S1CR25-12]
MRGGTRRAGWALVVAAGVAAFGLALWPGLSTRLPVGTAVSLAGNDYFLLGAVGGVALAVLAWMVARRATGRVDQASPPDPETVPDAPRPGERFDELLERWPWRVAESEAERLRERLRTDAVHQGMSEGLSRAAARERVDSGGWTDDAVAARFLAGAAPSPTERLWLALRRDSWTQYGARAAAAELTDRSGDR